MNISTLGASAAPVIVVADDDAPLRKIVAQVFRRIGFDVAEAGDAALALDALVRHEPAAVALFSDIQMPGPIDGLALAVQARARWPRLGIALASGGARPSPAALPASCRFLAKPYRAHEAVDCVRSVIAAECGVWLGGGV
jgi:DNA-binding NtrC family response regulator